MGDVLLVWGLRRLSGASRRGVAGFQFPFHGCVSGANSWRRPFGLPCIQVFPPPACSKGMGRERRCSMQTCRFRIEDELANLRPAVLEGHETGAQVLDADLPALDR